MIALRSPGGWGRASRAGSVAAVVAVIVLVGMPATVRAAWSAPVTISAAHGAISDLELASGPRGDLLAWKYNDLIAARGIFGPTGASIALAPPGGAFAPQRGLPPAYASGPLVDVGAGHVAQLIFLPRGPNTNAVEVAVGRTDGRFGAPTSVGASALVHRASLAGNAAGELVLAWIAAPANGTHRVVWVSVRPPGGRFGRPRLLSRGADAEQVTAAVGVDGDAVVAFASRQGRMLATVMRAGSRWGPLQNLGRATVGTETDVSASVLADARVIVAWYSTQLCEGGCVSPGYTRAAVQGPRARRFGRAQLLESDPEGLAGAPSGVSLAPVLLAAPQARPLIAFLGAPASTAGGVGGVVRVAALDGTRFGAPRTISPAGEREVGLSGAAGPRGSLLTWVRADSPDGLGTVFASQGGGPSGGFGRPEQVSPSEQAGAAVATYDVTATAWIVAWSSRPDTPSRSVVRESTGS